MAVAPVTQSTGRKSLPVPAEPSPAVASGVFPIVGLGASAGGLEALEQFLSNVPAGSGLAFVVVQHLDPTHKGILTELLQRGTTMKVMQVEDGVKVEPDCVYVIPPNKDLSLLSGVLHLLEPSARRGLRLPINSFFRSLADDQHERSVGVILSGMGSDGTLGLKAIKEQAGLVLVQDPATAKFDGMPRSVVDAGVADIVASAAELPARLLAHLRHAPQFVRPTLAPDAGMEKQVAKVVILLRTRTGHDFSLYKRNTLHRRIERRMGLHQIAQIDTYVRYLGENPQEVDLLFKELLIGVTSFFRDPEAWDQLRDEALPALLAGRTSDHTLRAWVPGCSTGEEAYSLAMVFREAVERLKPPGNFRLQIFATDLDRDAVDRARQGSFPAGISADMSPERLARFFVEEPRGYRVTKEIRDMVIFAPQNVIMDPPFTKLDLLTCRNLLIYLEPELQKKLFPLFHYSLKPGGVLFLGSAESVGAFTGLFAPIHAKSRLFRSEASGQRPPPPGIPAAMLPAAEAARLPVGRGVSTDSLQTVAEQWLLQRHAPAAVLVNAQGDIMFVSGRTGRYLEPAAGKANWNVFAMVREGLRYELSRLFQLARQQRDTVTARSVLLGAESDAARVDLSVQFLEKPEPLCGLAMVVFTDAAAPAAKGAPARTVRRGKREEELERELQVTRDEVQSTREQMQTSQEELRSTNEELQSTNEELQSANEELTTSQEEMQSLNEELQTVNAELQAKVDELSAASNDMKNLLNSTEIATVFLDNALKVRRFTEEATQIIPLIPGDVGRPVTDLAGSLIYPELAQDAREVLRTLVPVEKALTAPDGRWFAMRLMPYRTMDNRIDGVVITFTNMTVIRRLEADLRKVAGTEEGPRP